MTTAIGVYVARAADGEVLYVGSSGDIDARLRDHRNRKSPWVRLAESVERIETPTRHAAYALERQKIAALDPVFNTMGRGVAKKISRADGPVVAPRTEALAALIGSYGSVARLADAVEVNHMTMSAIWRGVSFPSGQVIARLIALTGLGFDELFEVVDANDPAAPITDAVRAPIDARLKPSEVAAVLRITPLHVAALCRDGKLVASKLGKSWRIERADLQAYLDSGRNDLVSA